MTANVTIRWKICRAHVCARPNGFRVVTPGSVPETLPCPAPTGTSQAQSGPTRAGWSAGCQASSTAAAGPWRRRCCHCRCRPGAYCWRGRRSRRRPAGRCDSGTRGCSYPPLWHHKTGWAPSFHDTAAITATSLPSRSTPRVLSGRTMYFDRPVGKGDNYYACGRSYTRRPSCTRPPRARKKKKKESATSLLRSSRALRRAHVQRDSRFRKSGRDQDRHGESFPLYCRVGLAARRRINGWKLSRVMLRDIQPRAPCRLVRSHRHRKFALFIGTDASTDSFTTLVAVALCGPLAE